MFRAFTLPRTMLAAAALSLAALPGLANAQTNNGLPPVSLPSTKAAPAATAKPVVKHSTKKHVAKVAKTKKVKASKTAAHKVKKPTKPVAM